MKEIPAIEDCEAAAHDHPPRPSRQVDERSLERAAALFRAVGDVARLRLVELLAQGRCCVSDLARASGSGMSTVSQQLRVLRAERLVTRERAGKHIYYSLTDAHVSELIASALAHAAERHLDQQHDHDEE